MHRLVSPGSVFRPQSLFALRSCFSSRSPVSFRWSTPFRPRVSSPTDSSLGALVVPFVAIVVGASLGLTSVARASTGTLYYEHAVPLEAGGSPIDLGSHAVTRLVDWDLDGDFDLLVGGGDGYVWLFRNGGTHSVPDFEAAEHVKVGEEPIRVGTTFTTACLVDVTGDGRRDLVVASGAGGRLYRNEGSDADPYFDHWDYLVGDDGHDGPPEGVDFLSPECNGRFDVGDWDGDGLADIWAGDFHGSLTFFRNVGDPAVPHFASGETLITWPYNTHPTLFDLNQDGRIDLTYGINWAYVGCYLNVGTANDPRIGDHVQLLYRDGSELNIRALNGDDTTPTFADLDGDGVPDLVSGGWNGRVWVLYGVPYAEILTRASEILEAHTSDLGSALAGDAALREELFGLHRVARSYVRSFLLSDETRLPVHDWYLAHVGDHPQYFRKQHLDPVIQPYVPWLAGQIWVNLYESLTDCPKLRLEVCQVAGLTGVHEELMLDHGVLFVENSSASAEQQRVVYEYLSALPPMIWDVELIQIADFLGPSAPGVRIEASSGVNIFSVDVGSWIENSFPSDSPPGYTDVYSIALAHEINHNTLDTVGRMAFPHLCRRKYELIDRASGPDIIFQDPVTNGIDWAATKVHFQDLGYWDGNPATWSDAWSWFWTSGPGRALEEHWLRNNLRLCVEAPQEAFATLANQYFTDSVLMLELAKSRWDRGISDPADEFVLFVEVYTQGLWPYSLGGLEVPFYRIDTHGTIDVSSARLFRDARGHISRVLHHDVAYRLTMDDEGFVTEFETLEPTDVVEESSLGPSLALHGAFPHPFDRSTMIALVTPARAPVNLRVYDVAGRLVRTLMSHETLESGRHRIEWNGRDDAGRDVASGVYFFHLEVGAKRASASVLRLP